MSCLAVFLFAAVLMFTPKKYTVLKGGTLIDGKGIIPIENSLVILEDDKIKSISQLRDTKIPFPAKVINAKGRYIIPGLVDMHVHCTEESFLPLFLINGVTAIRDVGNNIDFILTLRDEVNSGLRIGPSLFVAGYMINNRKIPFGASQHTAVIRNIKEAQKAVTLLAQRKVDWIKIYITLPKGVVRRVLFEADKFGIPVAGHLRKVDARFAAQWGISTIEHATGIAEALLGDEEFEDAPPLQTISNKTWLHVDRTKYDELIDLFIEKNVFIHANLTLYESFTLPVEKIRNKPFVELIPPTIVEGWDLYLSKQFLEVTQDKESWRITKERLEEFLIMFKEKGGKVLAGTDTPWPYLLPGFSLHRELELLVETGFTPMEAIWTATKYAAEALKQENNIGTLTEGKRADIVLLNSNPLEDIRALRDIHHVIKDGRIVKRKELLRSLRKNGF
ncbi:amidohydrolase family protein [Acidobacteriota bacterium]